MLSHFCNKDNDTNTFIASATQKNSSFSFFFHTFHTFLSDYNLEFTSKQIKIRNLFFYIKRGLWQSSFSEKYLGKLFNLSVS